MTIGPDPITRTLERSSRRGISAASFVVLIRSTKRSNR